MYLNWEVFNTAMIHWKFLKSIHKLLLLLLRLFYNKKKTKIKPNNLTSFIFTSFSFEYKYQSDPRNLRA